LKYKRKKQKILIFKSPANDAVIIENGHALHFSFNFDVTHKAIFLSETNDEIIAIAKAPRFSHCGCKDGANRAQSSLLYAEVQPVLATSVAKLGINKARRKHSS
jgi:hypothetical protein